MCFKKLISLSSILFAGLILAATSNETTGGSVLPGSNTATSTLPSQGKVLLGVELRPSFGTKVGEAHTENYIQAGYQFNPDLSVFYRQEFNTNLDDPTGKNLGLGMYAFDGSFRTKVANIWRSGNLSLSYEARLYLPTHKIKRDAGMLTAVRNYGRLKYKLSDSVALTFDEVPIFHLYSSSGTVLSSGAREANPFFENRIYLGPEVVFAKGLKLYFPIIIQNTRYSEFAFGTKNNNAWAHKLWIYPELTYALNPNLTLGIAYYSDNLAKSDFSGLNLTSGFEKGVSQLILSSSL